MGFASLCTVTGPRGQGGEGGLFLAGPCPNLHGINELKERSELVEGENAVATTSPPLP